MIKTSRQLKDLVKNTAHGDSAKSQLLIRNYAMERFLERVSLSEYKDNFVLKGGMLIAAMGDFYDLYILQNTGTEIDTKTLSAALSATCRKRESETVLIDYARRLDDIEESPVLQKHWENYQNKNSYAAGIGWHELMKEIRILCGKCIRINE